MNRRRMRALDDRARALADFAHDLSRALDRYGDDHPSHLDRDLAQAIAIATAVADDLACDCDFGRDRASASALASAAALASATANCSISEADRWDKRPRTRRAFSHYGTGGDLFLDERADNLRRRSARAGDFPAISPVPLVT